jgi:hypothetical protein
MPLADIKTSLTDEHWYRLASGKGVMVLHELRQLLGDPLFEDTMDSFGKENGGKKVTTAQFQAHTEQKAKKSLNGFFDSHVRQNNVSNGTAFSLLSFYRELGQSRLIVYGTADEVAANKEAAELLQKIIREKWSNITVPIKADKDVTDAELKTHHLVLIGRPDSNRLVQRFRADLPITFGSRSFVVRNKTYAHAGSAVVVAADNPINKRYSFVVIAGLSAEATYHAPTLFLEKENTAQVLVLPHGGTAQPLVLPGANMVVDLKAPAEK